MVLNFDTNISPMGTYMVDFTEKMSKSDSFVKSYVGVKAPGVLAGVAVLADLVPHALSALAKPIYKTGCKIVEFVPNLFGKGLNLTPENCTWGQAGVHAMKAIRNIPCAIILVFVGLIAPSYTAVASRAFGTSQAPVEAPKPQQAKSFMERAKDATIGGAKSVANAALHPLDTGSKVVSAISNNPKTAIAVATVVMGLVGGHYFGLTTIAKDYASGQGTVLYGSVSTLAQDYVGTPLTKGKDWVVGQANDAYNNVRCRFVDCVAEQKDIAEAQKLAKAAQQKEILEKYKADVDTYKEEVSKLGWWDRSVCALSTSKCPVPAPVEPTKA